MMLKEILKEQKGQALVEMALVLPVLLLLVLGIIEFGRLSNAYLILDHATREGARMASLGASDSDIETKVKSLSSLLPQNENITLNITPTPANRTQGQDVEVKTTYPFKFITPLIGDIFGSSITISSDIVMRME